MKLINLEGETKDGCYIQIKPERPQEITIEQLKEIIDKVFGTLEK